MNYEPEQLIITREAPVPPVTPPPEVEPPEVPPTGDLGGKEDVACPGPGNYELVILHSQVMKELTGHELSDDGKTCIDII